MTEVLIELCADTEEVNEILSEHSYKTYERTLIGRKYTTTIIVDKADQNIADKYPWHKNNRGYIAYRGSGKQVTLHREIMGLSHDDKEIVDHINGNKNDNRRCNLRVVSSSGNAQNRSTYESKSRFLGAMWNESYQKWSARIRVDGKQYFGGYYNTEEEAFTESERLRAMYAPFSQAACARKMMWKYIDFDSADCGYKHESLLPNSTCPECSKKIPKLKFKEPFYFEIGAGYRPTEGYVHNDLKFDNHIEVVYDAEKVHEILETKADIVRATHILEHFPFRNTVEILENWSSILKPGGQLYIEVPNVLGHANGVVSGETSEEDFGTFMYGEQDYPGNFHMAGFTPSILRKRLEQAGLENINIQDIGMVVIGSGTKVV